MLPCSPVKLLFNNTTTMKTFLLFALLLSACIQSFANVQQGNWRWRKDYGPEHLDAPKGTNENIPITITSADSVVRLRIEFATTDDGGIPVGTILYYHVDSLGGESFKIDAIDTSNAFVLGTLDSESSSERTTEQLTSIYPSYRFVPGWITDAASSPATLSLSTDRTEYEWVLKPTRNMKPGHRYVFFTENNTGTSANSPSLTVAGVLPVTFLSFTVQNENGKALIRWATTNEQTTDRFEIWRSSDGRNWNLLSTTGAQSRSGTGNYGVYDNAPLPGKSYYRVKEFDKEGASFSTSVQTLTMDAWQAINVLVYPNPFTSHILVQIPSQTTVVKSTVKLIDMQGKVQFVQTTTAGNLYIGNRLATGTYQLQVWQNNALVYHTLILKQ